MHFTLKYLFFGTLLLCCFFSYSQNEERIVVGDTFYKQGTKFLKQKQYDSSDYFLHNALKNYKATNNIKGLAKTFINLSSLKTYKQELDSANYYLLECQNIIKSLEDKSIQADLYLNIAHINFQNKDFIKALELAHLAETIQIQRKDTIGIATVYNNLAILYRRTNALEKAQSYNFRSLDLNILKKDSVGIAKSYNNIGLLYENLGDFEKTIHYYKLAIGINVASGINNASPYRNLGSIYLNLGKHKQSNNYYKKALEIEEIQKVDSRLKGVYNAMLHNYLRLKDFEKAVEFQEKRDRIEIKIVESKNEKEIEVLRQQQDLYYKKQELKYANAVSEKNRIIVLVVSGLLILTLLFFLQSHRTSKLKRKQEQLLLERKVLQAQMNPHFIFNALSAIQNSLMNNNPLESATYLSRFSKLVRQNFEFINHETIALSDDIDALKNYIETQQMRFNNSFSYTIDIASDVDVDIVKIPPLLIQPFIENSIEHGFKNKKEHGELQIEIKKENRFLHICIIDNGVGFNISELGKGQHSFSVFKKRLRLLSKASEKSFKISSSKAGTTVQFKLDCD